MDVKDLVKFNEWWEIGSVRNVEKFKRYLFYDILRFIDDRQIIMVTGLRRVGKTKLLYQIIQYLLERGVEAKKILYFSFDEEIADIKNVIDCYEKYVLGKSLKEIDRVYIFFDEIQKCKNWENKIKVYYDLYPNIKFFLSGSASLILSKQAKESLAGRIYEFVLKPLTFKEFLEMKNVKIDFEEAKLFSDKFFMYFLDFIKKSGFPEIVNEEDEEKIKMYVKSSVVEKVLYKDMSRYFKRFDIELIETLVNLFFKNPGMIINYDNLSKDLRRTKKTLINYIYYLRFSLLINMVSNFRTSVLSSSRKNKKVYPITTSLIFSYYGNFDNNILGKVLETIFCTEIDAKYYFKRGNKEIDFLVTTNNSIIPVEIKVDVTDSELKKFLSLVKKLKFKNGIILTLNKFDEVKDKDVGILVYPIWFYLLYKERIIKTLFT